MTSSKRPPDLIDHHLALQQAARRRYLKRKRASVAGNGKTGSEGAPA